MTDRGAPWDAVSVAALAGADGLFTDGDWVLSEDLQTGHDVRLLQLADIGVGRFVDRSSKWISQARFEELGCSLVEPGDVLISRMADPIARACIAPDLGYPCITAVDVAILRVGRQLASPRFVMHLLNSAPIRNAAEHEASGTTRKRISRSKLGALSIPLPPLDVQAQLVAETERHLAAATSGAAAFNRAAQGCARYRTACLSAAFGGDWNGESPAKEPLDQLASIQSGVTKGRHAGHNLVEMPYIRTANVQAGYLDLEVIKTLTVTSEQSRRHMLRDMDVLVLEGGDADKVGRGWLWEGQIRDCLHQNHVFAVRTGARLVQRYLAYYLNAPQARRYFLSCAKQTTNLASINKTQLKALPVPVPSVDEQRHLVGELDRQLAATADYERVLADHARDARQLMESIRTQVWRRASGGPSTGRATPSTVH